jgi:hypothetical protein
MVILQYIIDYVFYEIKVGHRIAKKKSIEFNTAPTFLIA